MREPHFSRLAPAKAEKDLRLPAEARTLPAQLGVRPENCHYFLEEITLAEEEPVYWHLPLDDRLSYAYRQMLAVRIFGGEVHFAQNYDADTAAYIPGLPRNFLMRPAVPPWERAGENRLIAGSDDWPPEWVSLGYLPALEGASAGSSARIVITFHQLSKGRSREAVARSAASLPTFRRADPLPAVAPASVPLDSLESVGRYDFPPGECVLKIPLDGADFHVFWHQKEESGDRPRYRIFFFNGAGVEGWRDFQRSEHFRYLDVSGGCMRDDAHSAVLKLKNVPPDRGGRYGVDICGIGYMGPAAENFHPRYAKIIRAILERQKIPEEQVLFMGLSMGGFMALKMGEYFPKAHIFAYNFQSDFFQLVEWNDNWRIYFHGIWRLINDSEDPLYLSPDLRNRALVQPDLLINGGRCVVCIVDKSDTHHRERQFLPLLHWIKWGYPQIRSWLHEHTSFQNPESLELCPGLHAIEIGEAGHGGLGRDFELGILDRLLRFMEERRRQVPSP